MISQPFISLDTQNFIVIFWWKQEIQQSDRLLFFLWAHRRRLIKYLTILVYFDRAILQILTLVRNIKFKYNISIRARNIKTKELVFFLKYFHKTQQQFAKFQGSHSNYISKNRAIYEDRPEQADILTSIHRFHTAQETSLIFLHIFSNISKKQACKCQFHQQAKIEKGINRILLTVK